MFDNLDRNILHQYLGTKLEADRPENVILMRSDVHDQFDDYQFTYTVVCTMRSASDTDIF